MAEPDLDLLPIMTCWPDDGGAVHHAAVGDHARPGDRRPQRRHVPAPEALADDARPALADPQGRRRRLARGRRPDGGGDRARHRSDHDLRGLDAAAEAHRRARRGRRAAQRPRRPGALQDGRPRGAGERRDRDRGLRRARRARARGAVRRPHGLLHADRAVPAAARHVHHAPPRPDLPVDRRRRAAVRGRLARQGDGADLPAGRADDRAGDRRLRPAVRRRLPQLLHRLDQQALPRPRARR